MPTDPLIALFAMSGLPLLAGGPHPLPPRRCPTSACFWQMWVFFTLSARCPLRLNLHHAGRSTTADAFWVAQRFRVCVRTKFRGTKVDQIQANPSPAGTIHLSPALQRGVKWNQQLKSRRDDPVLTRSAFSAAIQATEPDGFIR